MIISILILSMIGFGLIAALWVVGTGSSGELPENLLDESELPSCPRHPKTRLEAWFGQLNGNQLTKVTCPRCFKIVGFYRGFVSLEKFNGKLVLAKGHIKSDPVKGSSFIEAPRKNFNHPGWNKEPFRKK